MRCQGVGRPSGGIDKLEAANTDLLGVDGLWGAVVTWVHPAAGISLL